MKKTRIIYQFIFEKVQKAYFLAMATTVLMSATSMAQERLTVGGACTNGRNATDWDTIMQCNSSAWARAALFLGSSSNSCNSTYAGLMQYTSSTLQVCDNTTASWQTPVTYTAAAPYYTAPANNGYFVLSKTKNNGNFGNYAGVDSFCLTELTTNTDWNGYSTANSNGQLVAGNVRAFMCGGFSNCTQLVPYGTYQFATVGQPNSGGATFRADASGLGPNDSANWSAYNYFGGVFYYWMFSRGAGTSTTWSASQSSSGRQCSTTVNWDTGTSGRFSTVGYSATTNNTDDRWELDNQVTCDYQLRVICVVNP